MNNPGQYLVHLTSRGSSVFNSQDGGVGVFKIVTKQPLKDINKFGLLHYSIPKRLDHLQRNNRSFDIVLTFASGDTCVIPVTLPMMNYYDCLIHDISDFTASKDNIPTKLQKNYIKRRATAAFDEVLQTSINWSIMKYFTDRAAQAPANGVPSIPDQMTARISCIVDFDRTTGCYKFTFGYRGYNTLKANTDGKQTAVYRAGVLANSGCPFQNVVQGNIAPNAGGYTLIDAAGVVRTLPPIVVTGVPAAADNYNKLHLQGVTFNNMSMRLQIMMGASGSDLFSENQLPVSTVHTRGRIRLVNYQDGVRSTGMVVLAFNIPPTLSAPSMLYLQLQVPGTKTKILGQDAERGGWAVPTPPNSFFSNYNNFPANEQFDRYTVRSTPDIQIQQTDATALAQYEANFAKESLTTFAHQAGSGFNFDGIPYQALTQIGQTGVNHVDNFNCTPAINVVGSRMIMFGCHPNRTGMTIPIDCIRDPEAACKSNSTSTRSMPGGSGFSVGATRVAEVFTASMITPNWIYTHTQDATIQTFDIQLLWGDTCDVIDAIVGNPVQFSLIAST